MEKRWQISFITISANDVSQYPQDSPENMRRFAERRHFSFPYLYDESQEVARAYVAECTLDFSIFDGVQQCIYRGQLDDSRPGSQLAVSGHDLRQALDALLRGEAVDTRQKPSVGCNIKWKH